MNNKNIFSKWITIIGAIMVTVGPIILDFPFNEKILYISLGIVQVSRLIINKKIKITIRSIFTLICLFYFVTIFIVR